MSRPVTLFTGQWADLPIAELAEKCGAWGFDGLELACWGDHFDVAAAVSDPAYASGQRDLLANHGLNVWAIGNHLVGQAVCDPIDERHRAVLPPEVWGDGEPEGVRARAAERMQDTARAAAALGVEVVTGFTGSPIWHLLYSFPPNDWAAVDAGYEDFAERWGPIVDVFESEGVRFALEVHPTEIAYDFVTTRKALAANDHRAGFGINLAYYKTMSFALSAALTGVGGALYAHKVGFISPEQFTLIQSIELVTIVIIGGVGSLHGAVLGAAFIIMLPQGISIAKGWLPDTVPPAGLQSVVFGLILVAFIIFEPYGLYGRWLKIRTYFDVFPFYRRGTFRRQRSYLR